MFNPYRRQRCQHVGGRHGVNALVTNHWKGVLGQRFCSLCHMAVAAPSRAAQLDNRFGNASERRDFDEFLWLLYLLPLPFSRVMSLLDCPPVARRRLSCIGQAYSGEAAQPDTSLLAVDGNALYPVLVAGASHAKGQAMLCRCMSPERGCPGPAPPLAPSLHHHTGN